MFDTPPYSFDIKRKTIILFIGVLQVKIALSKKL